MPPEEIDQEIESGQEDKEIQEKPVASEPEKSVSDPIKEAIEKMAQATRESADLNKFNAQMISDLVRQRTEPAQPGSIIPEPEDLTPEMKQYLDAMLNEKVKGILAPLATTYSSDRENDLNYRASLEKERAKSSATRFNELEKDVDDIMSGVSLETRSRPGAWNDAYALALGRKIEAELRERNQRPSQVSGSGNLPTSIGQPKPSYAPEELEFLKGFGIESAEEAEKLSHVGNINDYRAMKSQKGQKK